MLEDLSISWSRWFILILIIIGIFMLVGFIIKVIERNTRTGGYFSQPTIKYLRKFRILLEPFGIGIIAMTFALINPIIHGSLILISLALAYIPLRNYFTGHLLLLNDSFSEGERIKVNSNEGVIDKIDRLGLTLQIKEGVRFINYTSLINDGFTKVEGERLEGINFLQIVPPEAMEDKSLGRLRDKLFACPYIDWFYPPEIKVVDQPNQQIAYKARLRVRQDQHLKHLMQLLEDWGYQCRPIL
jgi:hypothetical protein